MIDQIDIKSPSFRHTVIPNLLDKEFCNELIDALDDAKHGRLTPNSLNLNDSDDMCNIVYQSKRSPNLNYCYLRTKRVMEVSEFVIRSLRELTGIEWKSNINEVCLPVFEYLLGGFIKPHRGRDMGFGSNDIIAVMMLSTPADDFRGGRIFLNEFGEVSLDGKTVFKEEMNFRTYFDISQGSILLFNNNMHIHGTEPISDGIKITRRITASWRISI